MRQHRSVEIGISYVSEYAFWHTDAWRGEHPRTPGTTTPFVEIARGRTNNDHLPEIRVVWIQVHAVSSMPTSAREVRFAFALLIRHDGRRIEERESLVPLAGDSGIHIACLNARRDQRHLWLR